MTSGTKAGLAPRVLFRVLEGVRGPCLEVRYPGGAAVFGDEDAALRAEVEIRDERVFCRSLFGEDIAAHDAQTLRLWRERFLANRDRVRALGFEERLVRLWDHSLASCAAGFGERYIGDAQMLFVKPPSSQRPGGEPRGAEVLSAARTAPAEFLSSSPSRIGARRTS